MEWVLFWLAFSAAVGMFASGRGRSGIGWFFLSLIISPLLGFLFAAASSNVKEQKVGVAAKQKERKELANTKKCPQCAEMVKKEAKICRFCRYEFDETDEEEEYVPLIIETYKGWNIAKLEDDQFKVLDAVGNQAEGSKIYSSRDDAAAYIDLIGEFKHYV